MIAIHCTTFLPFRKKGVPEGPGRYKWSNGAEYDGEWRAGRFHGQGTYVWSDGEKYDGEWKVRRFKDTIQIPFLQLVSCFKLPMNQQTPQPRNTGRATGRPGPLPEEGRVDV